MLLMIIAVQAFYVNIKTILHRCPQPSLSSVPHRLQASLTRTTALFIWQKAGYFLKLVVSVPVKACHEPSVLFG
jgi:hypothetical protein